MKAVHFQTDNITALLYLMKMGGTGNQMLLKLSKEIWQYLLKHQIIITAEYLPSCLNVEADWQSRNSRDPSEWKLFPKVFQQVCQRRGMPVIDLFASRLSSQLPSILLGNLTLSVREQIPYSRFGAINPLCISPILPYSTSLEHSHKNME